MTSLLVLTALLTTGCKDGDDPGTDDTSTPEEIDADNDGFPQDDDCDDNDPAINPDADELCNDVDDDCDGDIDEDPVDQGTWYVDGDDDGYGDPDNFEVACEQPSGLVADNTDCDDTEREVNPGAAEVCNEIDDDCDGLIDDDDDSIDPDSQTSWHVDADADGFGDSADPGSLLCFDPSDETTTYVDDATDCDDADPAINPDATEVCDDLDTDEDCDGLIDDADDSLDPATATGWRPDADGDGFGDASDSGSLLCEAPVDGSDWVDDNTDCDDSRADVNPAATEVCDELDTDEDCDGLTDDADDSVDSGTWITWYLDGDTDGYGDAEDLGTPSCDGYAGSVLDNTDCDDFDSSVNPAATEVCDEDDVDEDCNGVADDADSGVDTSSYSSFYTDADSDGYGDASDAGTGSCDGASGTVADNTDCDDSDSSINPGATEVCDDDDVDEDCDGLSEDADSSVDSSTYSTWFVDMDVDGYGDEVDRGYSACDDPSDSATTYVLDNTDCDDADADVNPGEDEVCDEDDVDEDCDGLSDDADSSVDSGTQDIWYVDVDEDGYGDVDDAGTARCDDPSGATVFVEDNTDCDDSDATINPAATELCDEDDTDEDCNGVADDNDSGVDASTTTSFYSDADSDGYGDQDATATDACDPPSGTVAENTDCDDTDGDVNPGATEICDAADVDEDCNGVADDDDSGVDASSYYDFWVDGDGDGYGESGSGAIQQCDEPSGYADNDEDCDDGESANNPGATETRDAADNDCDDLCDEGFIAAGDLVISEFMPNPTQVGDSAGEWFEVYNASGVDISICAGWSIEDADTDSHDIGSELFVAAGEYLVFGKSDDPTANGGAAVDYAYGSDIALANSVDELILIFDGTDIDEVYYDVSSGGDWADAYSAGYSLELDGDALDSTSNDDAGNWCQAISSYGDGDYGTPGNTNDGECCVEASYTLTAEAYTIVNYGSASISPAIEVAAYTNGSSYDAAGYVRFDTSAVDDAAELLSASLALHGYNGYSSPYGSPETEIVYSEDDGWTGGGVSSSTDLGRDATVSTTTTSSFDNNGWNDFELDPTAWDYTQDWSDDLLTVGIDEVSGGSYQYVYFYGTSSGYEATLTLEVCE